MVKRGRVLPLLMWTDLFSHKWHIIAKFLESVYSARSDTEVGLVNLYLAER